MEKVTIDFERLCLELEKQGKTKADLSREMTKNKNFVGLMEKNPEQPVEVERLMCLIIGLEPGDLVKREGMGSEASVKVIENLHRDHKNILKLLEENAEMLEKILSKVSANTLQMERIKDDVKELKSVACLTDYDKAVRFLKEVLSGGRVDGSEVLRQADSAGIKRADLNKAKRDIGVNTANTGYGKNQKTWWFLS